MLLRGLQINSEGFSVNTGMVRWVLKRNESGRI